MAHARTCDAEAPSCGQTDGKPSQPGEGEGNASKSSRSVGAAEQDGPKEAREQLSSSGSERNSVRGWQCAGSALGRGNQCARGSKTTRYCWQAVRMPGQGASVNTSHFVGVRVNRIGLHDSRGSLGDVVASGSGVGSGTATMAISQPPAPCSPESPDLDSIGGRAGVADNPEAAGNDDAREEASTGTTPAQPPGGDGGGEHEASPCSVMRADCPGPSDRSCRAPVAQAAMAKAETKAETRPGRQQPAAGATRGTRAEAKPVVPVRRSSRLTENSRGARPATPAPCTVPQAHSCPAKACSAKHDKLGCAAGAPVPSPIDASSSRAMRALRRSGTAAELACSATASSERDRRPPQGEESTQAPETPACRTRETRAAARPSSAVMAARQRRLLKSGKEEDEAVNLGRPPKDEMSPCVVEESPRSARRRARAEGKGVAQEPATARLAVEEVSGGECSNLEASAPEAGDGTREQHCGGRDGPMAAVPGEAVEGADESCDGDLGKAGSVASPGDVIRVPSPDGGGASAGGEQPRKNTPQKALRMQGFPRQICQGQSVDEVSARLAAISESLYLMEQIAILPSLRRVARLVQRDVDGRSEEHAKNVAAVRIERVSPASCATMNRLVKAIGH